MEIQVDQMTSRVTAADSETLLAPSVVARLTRLIAEEVKAEMAREERARGERRLTASSTSAGSAPGSSGGGR